jgi:hypothetical protein
VVLDTPQSLTAVLDTA